MSIIAMSNMQHTLAAHDGISDIVNSDSQHNPNQKKRLKYTSSIVGKQRGLYIQREACTVNSICIGVGDIPPIDISVMVSWERASDWV